MEIHKIVNYKLDELGISRNKLAKMLEASAPNLYRFLNGERKAIGADKLIKMAKIIGLRNHFALFQIEKPKDLINYLDTSNKELSFQKSLFYLSLLYDAQYYDYEDASENLDSVAIMFSEVLKTSVTLNQKEMVQFISDILLYSKSLPSEIIREMINYRFGDVYSYTSYSDHKLISNSLEFDFSFLKEHDIDSLMKHNKNIKMGEALGFNIPDKDRLDLIQSIYRLRIDIYFSFISERIDIHDAISKLSDLEKIEDKLFKPRFGELEYTFFQIFNGEADSINSESTQSTIGSPYRNINLFSYFDPEGIEMSYKYHVGIHQYIGKESRNLIVGIQVQDDSLNRIFPFKSYVIVELDNEVNDGDYALISVNNQLAVIGKITFLHDKLLIEFNSYSDTKYPNRMINKDDFKILGKVIQGITII